MSIINITDRVLEYFQDSQWHGIEEVRKENLVQEKKLTEVIQFLEKQGMITIKNEQAKITLKGLKFLELPF